MTKPPVLLFAFANYYKPSGYLRNLPEERKQIKAALSQAEKDGLCKLEILPDATLQEIIKAFRKYAGRIVLFHFAGHADMYSLHLETPYREQDKLYMKSFANFLAEQKGLHLVFLNGCSTELQSKQLIDNGIPTVIATNNAISDAVAVEFATHFYESIKVGHINKAYKEAEAIINSQKKYLDYRALYQHEYHIKSNELPWKLHYGEEEVLNWNLSEVAGRPLYGLTPAPDAPFPTNPYHEDTLRAYQHMEYSIFWGRDEKIRQCYDYIVQDGVELVLLYGTEGIGKSSFLNAGILPYLKKDFSVTHYYYRNGEPPTDGSPLTQLQSGIIALDAPPDNLRDEVLELIDSQSDHQFIIALSTSKLKYWLEGIKRGNYHVKRCFLSPLDVSSIQKVISGGTEQLLSGEYKARLESDFITRLSMTLSEDSTACLPPLLQYAMKKLWQVATGKSLEQPVLSWGLYQKLVQEGLWGHFIENQLDAINEEFKQSGFALNILAAFLLAGPEKNYVQPVEDIICQFNEREGQVELALKQLVNQRLLCQPAEASIESSNYLRLSHRVLERPLYQLLNKSQRPGQEIQRILLQQQQGNHLSEEQLQQWQTYKWAIPTPSTEILTYIKKSKQIRIKQKSKLQRRRILNFLGLMLVLACGINMPNPYLLLFALLLYTAYHGARAMTEKI